MSRSPLSQSALLERIDALDFDLDDRIRTDPPDGPLRISFRFDNDGRDDYPFSTLQGFSDWKASQKVAIFDALRKIEAVADVTFSQRRFGDADIKFFRADDLEGAGGVSVFSYRIGEGRQIDLEGGSAYLSRLDLAAARNAGLVLHEIGHTLGLKHPGNYNFGDLPPPPRPYLPAAEDNTRYTIMAYEQAPDDYAEPVDLMIYDIAALQARYGANMSHRAGDDVYGAPRAGEFKVVWDAGGYDSIQWSGDAGAVIDTRAGSFSDLGARNNFAIAYGVQIEAARGGSGADRLIGGEGSQRLAGAGGDDRVFAGAGADRLLGGQGADLLNGGSGADVISAGLGNDRLFGQRDNDLMRGGFGDDTLRGGAGDDRLFGQAGADLLAAGGGGDMLKGGQGNDRLMGYGGADLLRGGPGADVLNGGGGNDRLTGGAGGDVFVFQRNGGDDTVSGFAPGVDHIRAPGPFGRLSITDAGDGALIGFAGGSALLVGVDADDLSRGDFLF
ncbi:MAG: M10 family metallopeptidase C-terminal domain-containing protein [Pikeienuella sp.]